MPKFTLLWNILKQASDDESGELINTSDLFIILTAILDFQVNEFVQEDHNQRKHTRNPLLYRNNKSGQLVFSSFADLEKFSIKFRNFKMNHKHNQLSTNLRNIGSSASDALIKQPMKKGEKSPKAI
jgi:hypothetical protein